MMLFRMELALMPKGEMLCNERTFSGEKATNMTTVITTVS